ncbi:MAG: hypothetical protein JW795_20380 [Chitinivibrionales bacterium]|nr:hypothetical protein [Chitinivibrionales bacterium]
MNLSSEEKNKCAQLWEWATNMRCEADVWNDTAADLLAQLYGEIIDFSEEFIWLSRSAGMPTVPWLLDQVYQPLVRTMANKHKVFQACKSIMAHSYQTRIQAALVPPQPILKNVDSINPPILKPM